MSFNLSTFISCFTNDYTNSSSLRTHHTFSSVFTFSYEKKPKYSQNRQSRQRQRPPILKRSTFQGFRQYPGNPRHCSLSNSRNNFPSTRFRSLSRSNSRPRFGNFNQPIECYYCHDMGHIANNCFRCQNRNFPCRLPNHGRKNNFRNSKQYTNYRTDTRYRNDNVTQCRVNFSELPMYLDLQTGNQ